MLFFQLQFFLLGVFSALSVKKLSLKRNDQNTHVVWQNNKQNSDHFHLDRYTSGKEIRRHLHRLYIAANGYRSMLLEIQRGTRRPPPTCGEYVHLRDNAMITPFWINLNFSSSLWFFGIFFPTSNKVELFYCRRHRLRFLRQSQVYLPDHLKFKWGIFYFQCVTLAALRYFDNTLCAEKKF